MGPAYSAPKGPPAGVPQLGLPAGPLPCTAHAHIPDADTCTFTDPAPWGAAATEPW